MKLNIQNKLLLPISLVVLLAMGAGALITSYQVSTQLEENFYGELNAVNTAVVRCVTTAYLSYQTDMGTISVAPLALKLVRDYAVTNKPAAPEQVAEANKAMEQFRKDFKQYKTIGVMAHDGTILAASTPALVGVKVTQRDYFKEAMQGKFNISVPMVSLEDKSKTVTVAMPVKDAAGKIQGVVFADLDCKQLANATISGIKIGETGFPFLVDSRGLMLAHPNYDLVESFDARNSEWGRQVLGKTEGRLAYKTQGGIPRLMSFMQEPSSQWYVIAAVDATEIDMVADRMRNMSLGIALIGIVVICLVVFLVVRPIIADLLRGVHFASKVAEGDLNEELSAKRGDELGTLFDALRHMVDNLKISIANAEGESRHAREESMKAQQAMQAAEVASKDAAAKAEGMQQAAVKLGEVVSIVSSASEQLSAQIGQSERGAAEQAARVGETATAMEEMNATVLEVARSAAEASQGALQTREKAVNGAQVVQQAVESIQQVQAQSLQLKVDMATLGENAQSINQIMGVISDIADQTNLLALNAAIEAARAGEAGRGFAVVADEVRKLAEKTMASTTDVGNAIKAIQVSADKSMAQVDAAVSTIEKATGLASQSGEALAEIVIMVDEAADQVRSIATASEEQSATSEEINQSVNQVNNIAAETSRSMQEAASAVSELARQAQGLTNLMEEMRKI